MSITIQRVNGKCVHNIASSSNLFSFKEDFNSSAPPLTNRDCVNLEVLQPPLIPTYLKSGNSYSRDQTPSSNLVAERTFEQQELNFTTCPQFTERELPLESILVEGASFNQVPQQSAFYQVR